MGVGQQARSDVYQPLLPLLRQIIHAGDEATFAHPAEQAFSRILSYYRIRWVYEPTTFVLAWSRDGRPAEMFTPDFYLPDHKLYIELTTMRQRLVTRKNRKVRRLRELYPNVRIKLLYRRDLLRLMETYQEALACRPGRILYTEDAIATRITELAAAIATDLTEDFGAEQVTHRSRALAVPDRAQPLLVLGVGRGSDLFLRTLTDRLTALGVDCECDRIELTRYRTLGGARRVRVRRGPRADLAGRRVLIVEDVISTALSLKYLIGWLRRRHVAGAEVCTLLDRRAARLVDVPIRYAGFEAPNELLIGFGLNLRRQFSDLPHIAAIAVD